MSTLSAVLLSENGHRVRLWSAFPEHVDELREARENRRYLPGVRLPDEVELRSQASDALEGADLAIQAVPTQFIRWWWRKLSPHCPAEMPICSVAKGIENETLLRPTQIVRDVLDGSADSRRCVGALSGPCIAPEAARKLPATVTVASTDPRFAEEVQVLYARPYFRAYTNPDLLGVELAGATKNVIAIAAGILDGLKLGNNAKASLLTRGLAEITRLGVALGARADTFAGLAGFGDLVTTCFSPVGRNRSFGEAIGRGDSVQEALGRTESVVEGVATTKSVVALARQAGVEMPITQAVFDVLFRGVSVRRAVEELMTRPLKAEA